MVRLPLIFVILCSCQVGTRSLSLNQLTNRDELPEASPSYQSTAVVNHPISAAATVYGRHGRHHHQHHPHEHHHGHSHQHSHDHHHPHSHHHGHGRGYGGGYGHGHGHKNGGYKQGYDSGFHKGHGYKGKKGFRDTSGYNKKAHGHFGKSKHKGYHDNGGKKFKGHKHKNKYYGDIDKGHKGKKGHHLGTKGHHNKGHKDKGFKNVYHKEEFHHNKKFYDDYDNKKYHNKYDDHDSYSKGHKGNDYKGGHYKAGFQNDKYGSKGEHQDSKYHDNDYKHKDSHGDKKYYGEDHKHGHKEGHKGGSGNKHGHGYHGGDHDHHHNDHPHHSHHNGDHDHDDHVHHDHDWHLHGHDHDPGWQSHEHDLHTYNHDHHDTAPHDHGSYSENKPLNSSSDETHESSEPETKYPKKAIYLPGNSELQNSPDLNKLSGPKEPSFSVASDHSKHPLSNSVYREQPIQSPPKSLKYSSDRFPPSTISSNVYHSKSHFKPSSFTTSFSDSKFLKPEHFSTLRTLHSSSSNVPATYSNVHLPQSLYVKPQHPIHYTNKVPNTQVLYYQIADSNPNSLSNSVFRANNINLQTHSNAKPLVLGGQINAVHPHLYVGHVENVKHPNTLGQHSVNLIKKTPTNSLLQHQTVAARTPKYPNFQPNPALYSKNTYKEKHPIMRLRPPSRHRHAIRSKPSVRHINGVIHPNSIEKYPDKYKNSSNAIYISSPSGIDVFDKDNHSASAIVTSGYRIGNNNEYSSNSKLTPKHAKKITRSVANTSESNPEKFRGTVHPDFYNKENAKSRTQSFSNFSEQGDSNIRNLEKIVPPHTSPIKSPEFTSAFASTIKHPNFENFGDFTKFFPLAR